MGKNTILEKREERRMKSGKWKEQKEKLLTRKVILYSHTKLSAAQYRSA